MNSIFSRQKILIFSSALIAALLVIPIFTFNQARSLSGSSFNAGRIMDDSIFFNPNTMDTASIQNFLNSKVPTCDTNGSLSVSYYYNSSTGQTSFSYFSGGSYVTTSRKTMGQNMYNWDASQNLPQLGSLTPFVCLENYTGNEPAMAADSYCSAIAGGSNKSAAQIIKDVSNACSINPEVLIILLQKEQGLVTDDWPWTYEYNSATGFGCPDTSSCDPSYAGFFNQVYYGARQYQVYAKQPSEFNYHANETDNIYYNPDTSCGYGAVYIQNQATAGLYNYTPYQPNAAALNNLYGDGDACSAYGNRNFWRDFTDWFGSTTSDSSSWGTIWNGSNLYLVVGRTYYYVPGPSIENAWGLGNYTPINNDPNVDPASYLASLTQGPNLGYVALDSDGIRYMMDNGNKFRLVDDNHVLAWGMAGDAAKGIYAVGLLGLTPSGGDAGMFGTSSTSGTTYLMDGTKIYAGANASSLSYWGYTGSNGTTVTDDILEKVNNTADLSSVATIDRYVNVGGRDSIIDSSTVLQFRSSAAENGWGTNSYISIPSYATNMMSAVTGVGTFVRASNDTKWYYLEGGNKHYVSSPAYLSLWGWGSSNPLTVISPGLLATFPTSGNLGYLVYSTLTGKNYLIDGGYKHWIPTVASASAWEGSQTVPGYTDTSLSLLPTGASAGTDVVGFSGDGRIYALDYGQLRGIPTYNILDAFGINRNNPIQTFTSSLGGLLARGSTVDYVIQDGSGNTYFLDDGYSYKIDSSYIDTWQAASPPTINAVTLSMFTASGATLDEALSQGGHYYIMDDRRLIDVGSDYSNYGLATSDFQSIDHNYFPVSSSSQLIGTPGSGKVWLLSMGQRYYIPNTGLLFDLGYGSISGITTLDQDIIATLPENAASATRLIKAPNSGVIFAVQGHGYGFWDSATFNAYLGSSQVMVEPQSIFQKFTFSGWTSRIIYGTDGKLYYVSGGQKQWIANPSLLDTRYAGVSWWNVPQYVIDSFPTGSTIIN